MHLLLLLEKEKTNIISHLRDRDDINLVQSSSVEGCFGLLDILPDIDAVIFDDSFSSDISKAAKELKLNVDFIYFGDLSLQLDFDYFRGVSNLDQLDEHLSNGLKVTPVLQGNDTTYTKIASESIIGLSKSPVDLFLRIRSGDYYNYIKYFLKGDELDRSKIEEQRSKGVLEYFVVTKDLHIFTQFVNRAYNKAVSLKNASGESLSINSVAQVFSLLHGVGFSEESCEVAFKTVENLKNTKNKDLRRELHRIFKGEKSFKFKKSIMTSIILINFSKKLKWVTLDNLNALNLCALLCDRELVEDDMCIMNSEYEMNTSRFQVSELKLVKNHALKASLWAERFDDLPAELSRLIKQHHGSATGYGFVRELTSQITLLSILYILVESVSSQILLSSGKLNIVAIIKDISSSYQSKKMSELADQLIVFFEESL